MAPVYGDLRASLASNGTLIGATANIVVAGMAETRGLEISFAYFFKVAFPMMLMTIVICQAYLSLFYFR